MLLTCTKLGGGYYSIYNLIILSNIQIWIINIEWEARSHFLSQNLFIFISKSRVVIKSLPFISIFNTFDW